MGRRAISLRLSYVGALVLPALLLNGLTLLFAWHGTPVCGELLAEVEVLHELDSPAHERWYVVRVQRLVKGDSSSQVLQVRLPADVLPEGFAPVALRHAGERFPVTGERIFVVLRRGRKCVYDVEHFWLGAPVRTARLPVSGESSGTAI